MALVHKQLAKIKFFCGLLELSKVVNLFYFISLRNSNTLNCIKGLPPLCMCVLGLISKHIRIRLASHSAIHRIPNLVVCQYLNLFYGTMHTYMYTNVCIKARLLETSRFEDIRNWGTCTAAWTTLSCANNNRRRSKIGCKGKRHSRQCVTFFRVILGNASVSVFTQNVIFGYASVSALKQNDFFNLDLIRHFRTWSKIFGCKNFLKKKIHFIECEAKVT